MYHYSSQLTTFVTNVVTQVILLVIITETCLLHYSIIIIKKVKSTIYINCLRGVLEFSKKYSLSVSVCVQMNYDTVSSTNQIVGCIQWIFY